MAPAADLAVMAAAAVLLVSGTAKVAQPRPIASTLVMLWNAVTGQARGAAPPTLGRLLGAGEIGLAAAVVLARSPAAAAALAVFAVGLSAAGAVGVASGAQLPCACFGRPGRALGYPHILQLPLWLAAAYSVGRVPALFSEGTRLEQGLAMLGACAAASAAFHTARLWRAVYPMARQRMARAVGAGGHPPAVGAP